MIKNAQWFTEAKIIKEDMNHTHIDTRYFLL